MAVHTKIQRLFIVRRLGALETPRDIAISFALHFPDTACSEMDVIAADPRFGVVDPDMLATFYDERAIVLADKKHAVFGESTARILALSRQAERCLVDQRIPEMRAIFCEIREEMASTATSGLGVGDVVEVTRITRTIVDPAAPTDPPSE